jgi:hypothetical protein
MGSGIKYVFDFVVVENFYNLFLETKETNMKLNKFLD